jgi:hypothetical protein
VNLTLATLPVLNSPLENGTFAGLTTRPDGTHCAVVLLPAHISNITWKKAIDWAAEQGGELPSRPVASLLFANVRSLLKSDWHWTHEVYKHNASYAWGCGFGDGYVGNDRHESFEGSAVAVRLIPITA